MHDTHTTTHFKHVSGELCLDFVNTVGGITGDQPSEYLTSYAALIAWSRQAQLLDDQAAQRLLDIAERQPQAAQATLQMAHDLRWALYRIFAAVAHGEPAPDDDLLTLNDALATAMQHARIEHTSDGYVWTWTDEDVLDRMLWPVVRSSAELLVEGDLTRVRQCHGEQCGWLFVDMTKNRSRRWCDMGDCGNLAKVRRFRSRHRKGDAEAAASQGDAS